MAFWFGFSDFSKAKWKNNLFYSKFIWKYRFSEYINKMWTIHNFYVFQEFVHFFCLPYAYFLF